MLRSLSGSDEIAIGLVSEDAKSEKSIETSQVLTQSTNPLEISRISRSQSCPQDSQEYLNSICSLQKAIIPDSGGKLKPPRPGKAIIPKGVLGCNNCKNRRIKCDETKPQCIKCVRSGRTCDGYEKRKPIWPTVSRNPETQHSDTSQSLAKSDWSNWSVSTDCTPLIDSSKLDSDPSLDYLPTPDTTPPKLDLNDQWSQLKSSKYVDYPRRLRARDPVNAGMGFQSLPYKENDLKMMPNFQNGTSIVSQGGIEPRPEGESFGLHHVKAGDVVKLLKPLGANINIPNIIHNKISNSDLEQNTMLTGNTIIPYEIKHVVPTDTERSIDLPPNRKTIDDWCVGVPLGSGVAGSESSRGFDNICTAMFNQEDLEERIAKHFSHDLAFGQSLIARLKEKPACVLPIFKEEEEEGGSPFGVSSYTMSISHTDVSRGTNSSSSPSQTETTPLSTTPPTSAGRAKYFNEDDDQSPDDRQPPTKRPNIATPQILGTSERRRLRCHFHAYCPHTHTQKTFMVSGWLNIHNLRGHYDTHHTVIRCSKCFQEFSKKTEKNSHAKICSKMERPPSIDVIDCDKSDEIDERIKPLRTWKLEDEEDGEMKSWIIKYKVELVTHPKGASRELAKWYIYWRILFPSYDGPVPSPFYSPAISPGNLRLERWLEVFQSLVETKAENNDPPLAELSAQIEYYKDVIREVYNLMQSAPGSTTGSRHPQQTLTCSTQSPESSVAFLSPEPSNTVLPENLLNEGTGGFTNMGGPPQHHIPMSDTDPNATLVPAIESPQNLHSLMPSACTDATLNGTAMATITAHSQLTSSNYFPYSTEPSSAQWIANVDLQNSSLGTIFSKHVQSNINASGQDGQASEQLEFSCKWCRGSGYVYIGVEKQNCLSCDVAFNVTR